MMDQFRRAYGPLVCGRCYRVSRPFADFDGTVHPVGEDWVYQGHNFVPYDNGLTLYVMIGGQSCAVRLHDVPEAQGPIVADLGSYLTERL